MPAYYCGFLEMVEILLVLNVWCCTREYGRNLLFLPKRVTLA